MEPLSREYGILLGAAAPAMLEKRDRLLQLVEKAEELGCPRAAGYLKTQVTRLDESVESLIRGFERS